MKFRVRAPVRVVPSAPKEVGVGVVQVSWKVGRLAVVTLPVGAGVVAIVWPRIAPAMLLSVSTCTPEEPISDENVMLVSLPIISVPDTPVKADDNGAFEIGMLIVNVLVLVAVVLLVTLM